MTGKLYGVGVGPGDPDLITRKAWRLIESASVIAYPILEDARSFARRIANDAVRSDAKVIKIKIPMSVERGPAQAAYDKGAADIADALRAGDDVIVLCEGDPFFYGSFMYLHARLKDEFEVEIVPGVSSVTACAAAAHLPLSARNEALTIIPGPVEGSLLRARIEAAEAVAVMKVGRHLEKIKQIVEDAGLLDAAWYVEYASLPEQVVMPLSEKTGDAPYFSMILISKGKDPWL
ncbi:MAG: precorrin-2 C(20)-methyltransferase [Pseudomonadota bacterium]